MSTERRIKLTNNSQNVKLFVKSPRIVVKQIGRQGKQGSKGDKGDTGYGMPTGGVAGQVLQKNSNSPYDFSWFTPNFLDKNYTQNFTVLSSVTVNHNLGKFPSVIVTDSAGDEVEGGVKHVNTSQLILTFNAPFSGTVSCN